MSTDSLNCRAARIIVAYTFNKWKTKTNFNLYRYAISWTEYDCNGARTGANSGIPGSSGACPGHCWYYFIYRSRESTLQRYTPGSEWRFIVYRQWRMD